MDINDIPAYYIIEPPYKYELRFGDAALVDSHYKKEDLPQVDGKLVFSESDTCHETQLIVLIKTIQEQQLMIDKLSARLNELEEHVHYMQGAMDAELSFKESISTLTEPESN